MSRPTVRLTTGRVATAASRPAHRKAPTSTDGNVDDGRSTRSIDVFVVDEDGTPVTGQDVAATFSSARVPATVRHQYSDIEGHAEFLREDPTEPVHVVIAVCGASFGPYTVERGAVYTVEISGE